MRFSLFKPATKQARSVAVSRSEPIRPADESAPRCPPCTGNCFQGRACPASPTADPTLVALLKVTRKQ
jgi:hypothetical protein